MEQPVHQLVIEPRIQGRHLLDLDHKTDLAQYKLDHLLKEGDLLALACIQLAQLGGRKIADEARAVGGALERVVVNDYEPAVGRKVHVAFDEVTSGGDGGTEGTHGVLRMFRRIAAVAAYQRPPLIVCSLVAIADRLSQDVRSV